MQDNDFRKKLIVPDSKSPNNKPVLNAPDTEALYLYTDNSLRNIVDFLREYYYKEKSTQDMTEHTDTPSHAKSYFYSLEFELSHAYDDFLDGSVSSKKFKEQFDSLCTKYKTDPLKIYETHDLVKMAKKDKNRMNLDNVVNSLENQADEYWKEKQNKTDREK